MYATAQNFNIAKGHTSRIDQWRGMEAGRKGGAMVQPAHPLGVCRHVHHPRRIGAGTGMQLNEQLSGLILRFSPSKAVEYQGAWGKLSIHH